MKTDLKPCPFCGHTETLQFSPCVYLGSPFDIHPSISCLKCGYTIKGAMEEIKGTRKEVDDYNNQMFIDWWNTRKYEDERKMQTYIKPCPMCGGEAVLKSAGSDIPICWIECRDCGLTTPRAHQKEVVLERWNKRQEKEK